MSENNNHGSASDKRQNIRFAEKDEALRADVRSLGAMVGELLLEQGGEALYKTVESARQLAIARREDDTEASEKLDKLLGKMSASAARDIVRAFSTYFQVVNTAGQVHRIRRRRDYLKDTDIRQPRALDATVFMLRNAGLNPETVQELLQRIRIEPVFTPHPTETTRRTILRKHQNIVRRMVDKQNPALTPQEFNACFESIRADITAIWQTEESPNEEATVFDELEHMLFFLTDVIYRVIPPFYESLEDALQDAWPDGPAFTVPNVLHFSSWIGGDLSANPEISARTIRETLARQRSLILDLYYRDCQGLAEKLSQSTSRVDVDQEILDQIESYGRQFPGGQGSMTHRYRNMPYRMLLRLICKRLKATYDDSAFPYESADQFIADLRLISRSLANRKGMNAGLFAVERLIRRAETFDFHFLSLDIRCNSTDLQRVVGYCLGDPEWLNHSSVYRSERIQKVLSVNDSPTVEPDNDAKRLLAIFSAITYCRRKYGDLAIGVFLVRHCAGTDDVLAALLLARWAGMFSARGAIPLDIAPAFESRAELAGASAMVSKLLRNPLYKENLMAQGAHQIVMLSTSGESSDGGVAASRWNMERAHSSLGKIFADENIDYTLFHGRGSFSGRGGVADSIACGHLRATEHGESVNERYGVRGIAFRTLEKAFSAVVTATAGLDKKRPDNGEWGEAMDTIAGCGDRMFDDLVEDGGRFNEYFRLATPVDVIERMRAGQAGSDNDANRNGVPWTFAWAQSRYLLPSWYGFGSGLELAADHYGEERLQEMMENWVFFDRLASDVETALAIADPAIAKHYSKLAGDELHEKYFPIIVREFDKSIAMILKLRGQKRLLEKSDTLRRSIRLRNPYVDPMSLLQVELLRRWRSAGREDDTLLTALVASVNGIARGLQTEF
ncbi:MAG: phosphoenolpyruvate carboxylase [Gammaproteobacteria bacterium]|jgi:phosphoenolpyruvate carboxylase